MANYVIGDDKCLVDLDSAMSEIITDLHNADISLSNDIDELQNDVSTLQSNALQINVKISSLEASDTNTDGKISSLQTDVSSLESNVESLQGTVANENTFGLVKLTETPNPSGVADSTKSALSACGAYKLNQRINSMRLPVGAAIGVTIDLANAALLAETLGYGTWTEIGNLTIGSTTLTFYKRTE